MDAMRAGVDSIEHGSELNQEALDYMKSHNIVLVPTVKAAAGGAVPANEPPPPPGSFGASAYSRFKSQQLAPLHLASFALALKSGVAIAGGSDNAYTPGSTGIIAELLACVAHGMAPRQAIVSATINSAALVGLPKLGHLSSGMEGDFVAMDGDPTADIQAIEKIRVVVFKGRVIVDRTKPTS
jgi:imidazolonepropionase-like amidohydrolase